MKRSIIRKILIALVPIFLLMQFYRIDKANPPVKANEDFLTSEQAPAGIAKMIKAACYDCHSHETHYPWYTNVMPFSKWIKGHIDHGRSHMNFSTWASYPQTEKNEMLKECAAAVLETRMPLTTYLIGHSEARISKEQRKELADWFEGLKK